MEGNARHSQAQVTDFEEADFQEAGNQSGWLCGERKLKIKTKGTVTECHGRGKKEECKRANVPPSVMLQKVQGSSFKTASKLEMAQKVVCSSGGYYRQVQ